MALNDYARTRWRLRSFASSAAQSFAQRIDPSLLQSKYNITASQKGKFLWYRVAKVGTRTIYNRLKENGADLSIDHSFALAYDAQQYSDYFQFAFVRNPWDRLVSCWQNKIVSRGSFDNAPWLQRLSRKKSLEISESDFEKLQDFPRFVDWIEQHRIGEVEIHVRPQSALIDLNNCDFFGRMESFEDDLAHVFERIGLRTDNRTVRNQTSGRKRYQDYYTPELADRVGALYNKDVQLFGYHFDG